MKILRKNKDYKDRDYSREYYEKMYKRDNAVLFYSLIGCILGIVTILVAYAFKLV